MKKLLDIGCGPGTINNIGTYISYEQECKIYGIDLLKKNIDAIQKRYPSGQFQIANGERIPFPESMFDFILVKHVLEHTENVNKMLQEIKRVGKKKAQILIALPHTKMEHFLDKIIPRYLGKSHHHQRVFDKKEIIELLEANGFMVVSVAPKKWLMFVIITTFAVLSSLSKNVNMEEQSGVFHVGKKNYLKNKVLYPFYLLIYKFIMLMDIIPLSFFIPFELEIKAISD